MARDFSLHGRLVTLLKKSRKAVRLYGGVTKAKRGSKYAEAQAQEWLNVNVELVSRLSLILERVQPRNAGAEAALLLEYFHRQAKETAKEILIVKGKLHQSADRDDFVTCSKASIYLVSLKARLQAYEAVVAEICSTLGISEEEIESVKPIVLGKDDEIKSSSKHKSPQKAQVIQLKRRKSS